MLQEGKHIYIYILYNVVIFYFYREAQRTILDLEHLAKQLKEGQEKILAQESNYHSLCTDIESARKDFTSINSMTQLENQNILSVRSRLTEMREECEKYESRVAMLKSKTTEEENKLRSAKNIAGDQIRILQNDLLHLQNAIKTSQGTISELERGRVRFEEEMEIRRRELEQQNNSIAREINEAERKNAHLASDLRNVKQEHDILQQKKKQLAAEVDRHSFAQKEEHQRLITSIEESRRRFDDLEKNIIEHEKKYRSVREKTNAVETEQTLLRISVEELKRQQTDLDRSLDLRRRAADEELSAVQQQAQVSLRSVRQTASQIEQKKSDNEIIIAEIRTNERRLEELRRSMRESESEVENTKETNKNLLLEIDKIRKDVAVEKREEEDTRSRIQLLKVSIESDTRASEDLRRKISILTDEENSLKEGEMRLKSALMQQKKQLEECQKEVEECRSLSERERRLYLEIRNKKTQLEAEQARNEEELKFAKELLVEEDRRKNEIFLTTQQAREEASRLQVEMIALQRKHAESQRIEADIKRREKEAANLHMKMRSEVDSMGYLVSAEKQNIEKIRIEKESLVKDVKHYKEELRNLQSEINSSKIEVESMKAQSMQVEAMKQELMLEVNRLRESSKMESERAERFTDAYKDLELRLRDVRSELSRTEENYARAKERAESEERKAEEKFRAVHNASLDLSKVEATMAEVQMSINLERSKAIEEIGKLSFAKHAAQNQIFQLTDARQRSERNSLSDIGRENILVPKYTADPIYNKNDHFRLHSASDRTYRDNSTKRTEIIGNDKFNMFPGSENNEEADLSTEVQKLRAQTAAVLRSSGGKSSV